MENTNILRSLSLALSNIRRASSLALQGYLFGSRFARFEFRRSFLRPWLNSLGAVGAWILNFLCVAAVFASLWLLLWLGYDAGMIM